MGQMQNTVKTTKEVSSCIKNMEQTKTPKGGSSAPSNDKMTGKLVTKP